MNLDVRICEVFKKMDDYPPEEAAIEARWRKTGGVDEDNEAPVREKSRRNRIKLKRAKRHRKRFYVCVGGRLRARKTGVKFIPQNVERRHPTCDEK